jgi:hypothetical protein
MNSWLVVLNRERPTNKYLVSKFDFTKGLEKRIAVGCYYTWREQPTNPTFTPL